MASTTVCSNLVAGTRLGASTRSVAGLKNASPLYKRSTINRAVTLVCEANKTESTSAIEAATKAVSSVQIPAAARPALVTALANVVMATPAHAGVLFDFNATLPIIMGQFLVLMFILDKVVFSPVGKVLDERDGEIRSKIGNTDADEAKIASMQAEAKDIVSAALKDAKAEQEALEKKTNDEGAEKLATARGKLEAEFAVSMAALESSEAGLQASLEKEVDTLAEEIAAKILNGASESTTAASPSPATTTA
mmetsp:Transcript_10019/g.11684  ORF Transcript_10019/g.11684 Transcript_10019/m.11684 type:complete len:251 (-) Transcript_10019:213-965(-)|eukprot:CAMPEP_0197850738 /NCGR_PEP_ID=MMETSP1438-20131217/16225_1 /TAXON_ID=1461541 /ORGANISM="Pterosperma sp., Strain CCMP1384" /LENGTH=250 /DNA_ID=CAMNT_0043464059 /DNA_START=124 /DNA_END=876 /DNA_ORIENTATION=+